jgi:transcriptional regulator with XRE-family HTH domain
MYGICLVWTKRSKTMGKPLANTADFFRRRRIELGLTRKQIAMAAGVGVAAVGSWERIAAYPCLGRIDALAGVYRVDVHHMLGIAKALADAVRERKANFQRRGAEDAERNT